jgi:hypothetical protein
LDSTTTGQRAIAEYFNEQARWRQEKAAEYPDDPRNLSREEGKAGTAVRVEADAEGAHSEPVVIRPVPGWVRRPDRMYYAPSELEPAPD